MLSEPTYLGARMVAPTLEVHFARHRAAATQHCDSLPPTPPAALLEAIIDVAFWASLRREEGRPPRISLALLTPQEAGSRCCLGTGCALRRRYSSSWRRPLSTPAFTWG